jgi:outer membrane immunogenic protein
MVWGAFMSKKSHCRLASLTLLDIAAGIAVSAAALPALAADMPSKMPTKAPPIVAPAYNWNGVYIGGHAGYRWTDADLTADPFTFATPGGPLTVPGRNENYKLNGGIVGIHGGYNYLVAPQWLIGVEGDWSWGHSSDSLATTITGSGSDGFTLNLNRNSEVTLNWQATLRGRLGFVNGPWLLYGTGGVAFAHVKWNESTVLNTTGPATVTSSAWSDSKTLTGWVAGAGVEYMFATNWIGRVEYLYESFGDFTVPTGLVLAGSPPRAGNLDLSAVQKVRIGISYKFGP